LTADGWPARRDPRTGIVVSFDEERGLGTVADADGSTFDFHCTAITDGSRAVEVGRPVAFVVRPGHRGRLEARELVKR
jgi:cold shock CspA family protein